MKHAELLSVRDLHVQVGEKEILHGVNLSVGTDETHVLLGPNGTGKSTLGYAITGNPAYQVTRGSITFDGEDITSMPVNERAKKGVFLSFQNPLEVPGVTLSAFIRTALEQKSGSRIRLWDFKKKLKETMALLSMVSSGFFCTDNISNFFKLFCARKRTSAELYYFLHSCYSSNVILRCCFEFPVNSNNTAFCIIGSLLYSVPQFL